MQFFVVVFSSLKVVDLGWKTMFSLFLSTKDSAPVQHNLFIFVKSECYSDEIL